MRGSSLIFTRGPSWRVFSLESSSYLILCVPGFIVRNLWKLKSFPYWPTLLARVPSSRYLKKTVPFVPSSFIRIGSIKKKGLKSTIPVAAPTVSKTLFPTFPQPSSGVGFKVINGKPFIVLVSMFFWWIWTRSGIKLY